LTVSSDTVAGDLRAIADGITDGAVDPATLALGLAALVVMVASRIAHTRVPGVLIVVVVSMALTAGLDWSEQIAVVGHLPEGLPAPALAGLDWGDVGSLIGPALGI